MSDVLERWADVVRIARMTDGGEEYDPRETYGHALRLAVVDLADEVARLREALRKIEACKGYSSDPLVSSASVCIGTMKEIARAALEGK